MSVVIKEGDIQQLREDQEALFRLLVAQNEAIKSISSSMAKMIETDSKNIEAVKVLVKKVQFLSEIVEDSANLSV